MYTGKVNKAIIRITGLLGDAPKKNGLQLAQLLMKNNYKEEKFPVTDINGTKEKDEHSIQFLKDYFYPGFRNIMFLKEDKLNNQRFILDKEFAVELVKRNHTEQELSKFPLLVKSTEIFLFPEQISLFSLSIEINSHDINYQNINDVLYLTRLFNSMTSENIQWHEWISQNILCGIPLRGENVKADEYSGSKFKLFTVIDCDVTAEERSNLLFDMATVSEIGSSKVKTNYSHHNDYFKEIMNKRISVFNNWDAICLFDTFTCIGNGVLKNEGACKTWDYTYFRIYLYRLFFKYNIFRYNSAVHDKPVDLKKQFISFLNYYNLNPISFNFLGNIIFHRMGEALQINEELDAFKSRITQLSTVIQEEKQNKTNNLLKAVTILGGISSIQPVLLILNNAKNYLGWSYIQFYSLLSFLVLIIGAGLLYYFMPEKFERTSLWGKKNYK